ncbi:RlpA-like double-psi beta-barrel-protein domain-containing protein-containing protein [Lentinula aff. detonsa]|uniref:RlpA-like double-psi beta-barrel-protein domain-containing protein-containing protein n=1 Tax=Lentinula aff. detonsa TaxID=2804958 RepID=A0AA38L4E6_9AGAR|nr:RlpA-like double-psi beta-barrel-protein domain-containing protein-containing protein [Lentinula aff. detonsa]
MFTFMIVPIIFALLSSLVAGRAIPIRKSLEGKRSVTVTDFSGGTGDGTYYDAGLGACGITNSDTDYIAAIGEDFFDQYAIHMGVTSGNPNENPICNKKVIATYQGKSVTVAITDRCGGCTNPYSLDFTPTAFSQLADQSVGRITGMTWVWADSDSSGSDSGSESSPSSSSSASDASSTSDSGSDSSSSSSSSSPTPTDTSTPAATTTATDTWTSGTNTWTSTSESSTSTSTSSTSSITAGVVANVGSLNNESSSSSESGFVTRSSSSVLPTGTSLGGSSPVTTQASKQSSGARRSIRRIWEL